VNDSLDELFATISSRRKANADDSYVANLNRAGLNKILEKVGEEAIEVIIAAKEHNDKTEPRELTKEMADLWFHLLVLLDHLGVNPELISQELTSRQGTSGLEEKRLRYSKE
jgi:phosphoribosyl-ATP pyrophosphohydrolase